MLAATAAALLGAGAAGTGLAYWSAGSPGAGPRPGAAATPARPTPSPTPDHPALARTRIVRYLRGVGGRVSLAVRDRATGLAVVAGTRRYQTASIVKVDILAALLLRRQEQGRTLSADERRRARTMIVVSDNAAASSLYAAIGHRAGLTAANRTLGLRQTTPAASWGLTTTTAADQLRLLTVLTDPAGPLDADGRAFLLGLMGQVDEAQDWGITAAAGRASTASCVKNGWTTVDADNGLWLANSIGRIVEPGRDWLVAVLSDHHPTRQQGIAAVEKAARYALTELRAVPSPGTPAH
ncbi:serine hydrolase [Micromonospora sp. WMMD1102]|uniref:serine hydrolase n=1 Tax=Micromonospora sp. WMMD1102 TaxID=3016105 RepID=UPI0024154E25|nr:serine hydrolase [Micromonospora sp. WMMD1102]MDG4789222.1 serine hydrolase [Micromonospora sp. WMMD1102]